MSKIKSKIANAQNFPLERAYGILKLWKITPDFLFPEKNWRKSVENSQSYWLAKFLKPAATISCMQICKKKFAIKFLHAMYKCCHVIKINKQRKKHTTQMKKYEWISSDKQNFKIAAANWNFE